MWMGHNPSWPVSLEEEIGTQILEEEDLSKACGEHGHLQAKERGPRRNQPCWYLGLGLLASESVRK